MKSRRLFAAFVIVALVAASGWSFFKLAEDEDPAGEMTAAASKYLASLDEEQRKTSQLEYGTPQRVEWHFIPKEERKGLQIKHMNEEQREAALALLQSCLSDIGYGKAKKIMALESVLYALEGDKRKWARDSERYYFTVFGEPKDDGKWGLSIEGHHLSLNFVVENNKVVSSTPTFFAANPAEVKADVPGDHGIKKGERVLAKEEQLGFDLVAALSDEQKKTAVIADEAPAEIRAAGEPQPPKDEQVGISYGDLNEDQQEIMRNLVTAYAENVPEELQRQRVQAIVQAGPKNVRFAWAGAQKPGIGHYYRIQGPTFLIEFVNTQPDAAGNPANHIHCVWRDMHGDFAIPIE